MQSAVISSSEGQAMKKTVHLGFQDYVAKLYKEGETTIREVAEIL